MPRFNPDPTKVSGGFEIHPKDEYQIELGEPKAFYNQGKNGKPDNYGVRFPSRIVSDNAKGKRGPMLSCFYHTEDAAGFSKQIQMAALGINPKESGADDRFNTEYGHLDWSFNTDDGSIGDGWREMSKKIITVDLDIGENPNTGDQTQTVSNYRPF